MIDYCHLQGRNSVLADFHSMYKLISFFITSLIMVYGTWSFNLFAFIHCGFYFVLPDNVDLGTACGRYFRVSCLSIVDPGTSNLYSPCVTASSLRQIWLTLFSFCCSSGDSDIIKSLPGDQWEMLFGYNALKA